MEPYTGSRRNQGPGSSGGGGRSQGGGTGSKGARDTGGSKANNNQGKAAPKAFEGLSVQEKVDRCCRSFNTTRGCNDKQCGKAHICSRQVGGHGLLEP